MAVLSRRVHATRGAGLARAVVAALALAIGAAAASGSAAPSRNDFENYVVRAMPQQEIEDLRLPAPELPDLSAFTEQAVMAKLKTAPRGRAGLRRLVDMIQFKEFAGSDGRLAEWARRQPTQPRAIYIEDGTVTPADLARQIDRQWFEETEPGVFVLRLPLIVAQGATLHIDSRTRDFRMSEERGAFLVNDGRLFITGSRLTAWREKDDAPARFRGERDFRPFLLSWGGTETYIVGSTVESLGYAAGKSYGVTISQYTPGTVRQMKRASPRAWILDSEFVDNWYGFYCYEADDLVLVRNVYRDNITYAIDPHDRSNRLIIAENDIYGTHKKHGLIISREVNNSWIFRNRAHHNGLSGIVIDRNCAHNVVADNTVFGNRADGITVYESSDNLLWNNHAVGNERHGIRVRNSQRLRLYNNHAIANGSSGIYGHIKDLSGTDRNLRMDPFSAEVSMIVFGGQLIYNESGPIAIDQPLSLELYDVGMLAPSRSSGLQMSGVIGKNQHTVLDILMRQKLPVVIEPAQGAGRGV
ncbi:MAG: mannuronan 5-epimerase AlgG [Sinimarinibacterium sp.]|jgi:poly(beta-D-mannuronate) C5 epimerase